MNERNEPMGPPLQTSPLVSSWGHFFHVIGCKGEGALLIKTDILKEYTISPSASGVQPTA